MLIFQDFQDTFTKKNIRFNRLNFMFFINYAFYYTSNLLNHCVNYILTYMEENFSNKNFALDFDYKRIFDVFEN